LTLVKRPIAYHIYRRSLIAAFIGNVVGALFVAAPFTYFYWAELNIAFPRDKLADAEGGGPHMVRGAQSDSTSDEMIKKD
jgi:hypothetical protein